MAKKSSPVPGLPPEYKYPLIVGSAVVGFFLAKSVIAPLVDIKENIAQNQAANPDSPGGVAAEIWAAGHTGLWGSTEDEERIIKAAHKIPNFDFYKDVIKAYRAQHTGEELEEDLYWWLSSDEYVQFKTIIENNAKNL